MNLSFMIFSRVAKQNFPVDFLETTAKLKEELFNEENKLKMKTQNINAIEEKYKSLLRKEKMIQR